MSSIKAKGVQIIETKNGVVMKKIVREIDTTGKEDRIYEICKVCQKGPYPHCLDYCASARFNRERES